MAGGKLVPILFTTGRRMSPEIVGSDLLVRTAARPTYAPSAIDSV
ncbi:hypothetical protein [Streptomyces sp. ICC1]|nr:hypothetical protein [Streptomyces sp. ICC1]